MWSDLLENHIYYPDKLDNSIIMYLEMDFKILMWDYVSSTPILLSYMPGCVGYQQWFQSIGWSLPNIKESELNWFGNHYWYKNKYCVFECPIGDAELNELKKIWNI